MDPRSLALHDDFSFMNMISTSVDPGTTPEASNPPKAPAGEPHRADPHARSLRIALFSGNYNNVVDGPVKALNRLVGYLLDHGHEVRVFAPTVDEPAIAPTGTLISVPSVSIPGRSEYRLAGGIRQRVQTVTNDRAGERYEGRIRDVISRFAPDLIHLSAPDYLGFSALGHARRHAIPAVASFHTRFDTYLQYYGVAFLRPLFIRLMRNFYNRCEHVYVPSQSMADALLADRIGRDVRFWTRGVDQDLFSPSHRDDAWRAAHGFQPGSVVVLFVGRLVLEKGLDVFAEAFERARETIPQLRALVIGDGPERARFEGRLPPDSVFLGYQGGEDLARGYANADIFFNPSITETFGNVTLEAMASGLATVCAEASGSVSLITHGQTGYLGPPAVSGLCGPLVELAQDPETRRRFGDNARRRSSDYDWNAVLDDLVMNYQEAIDRY